MKKNAQNLCICVTGGNFYLFVLQYQKNDFIKMCYDTNLFVLRLETHYFTGNLNQKNVFNELKLQANAIKCTKNISLLENI